MVVAAAMTTDMIAHVVAAGMTTDTAVGAAASIVMPAAASKPALAVSGKAPATAEDAGRFAHHVGSIETTWSPWSFAGWRDIEAISARCRAVEFLEKLRR